MDQQHPSKNLIELKINADPFYLCIARKAVQRTAELVGMNEQDTDSLILAVDEALTNVIQHGYGGACEQQIIIKLRQITSDQKEPTGLEVIIRDFGQQVDPKTINGRDLDNIRPGGLGIHIIRSVMDQVEYIPQPQGGMQLRMIKYI